MNGRTNGAVHVAAVVGLIFGLVGLAVGIRMGRAVAVSQWEPRVKALSEANIKLSDKLADAWRQLGEAEAANRGLARLAREQLRLSTKTMADGVRARELKWLQMTEHTLSDLARKADPPVFVQLSDVPELALAVACVEWLHSQEDVVDWLRTLPPQTLGMIGYIDAHGDAKPILESTSITRGTDDVPDSSTTPQGEKP